MRLPAVEHVNYSFLHNSLNRSDFLPGNPVLQIVIVLEPSCLHRHFHNCMPHVQFVLYASFWVQHCSGCSIAGAVNLCALQLHDEPLSSSGNVSLLPAAVALPFSKPSICLHWASRTDLCSLSSEELLQHTICFDSTQWKHPAQQSSASHAGVHTC